MKYQKIDYSQTKVFSKTVIDYLNGSEELKSFQSYNIDITQVPNIIKDINQSQKADRANLVEALQYQYKDYVPNLKVVKNITRLRDKNTFTITTAHQLNLFTGPLYYIFKILNTIKVTNDLNTRYPNYNFVPCYWMGSEDHDFEEVNHTYLFNKKVEWNKFQNGSLGEYDTEGIIPLLEEVKSIIRQAPYLEELISALNRSYSHSTLADAVRVLLDELFGRYGLVVIDGNCIALKKPFTPIIEDELSNQTSSKLVQQQIEKLESAGYKSQASPRPINLFYKTQNSRERIVLNQSTFELAGSKRSFGKDDLLKTVIEHPERFSPNVILRPLHQQLILPNIAYIGGGSEIAYWLQLKTLFEHYNIHFPMLLLRTSAQIISKNHQKKLSKLNIDTSSIFNDVESLKKAFIAHQNEIDLHLSDEKEALENLFNELGNKSEKIDASLKSWIGAEGQKSLKSLENISKRLIKSEKAKNEQSMQQIEKLVDQLFPNGSLQERRENMMPLYAQYGPNLFNKLLEILDPFEQQFYLIETDK